MLKAMKKPLYTVLASTYIAWKNCQEKGNIEWFGKHQERLTDLVKNHLPHGSGFDSGCRFSFNRSTPDRLVIHTSFHHMDENGYYAGWTEHTVIVTASLAFGIEIRITGRDRNAWKDFAHDVFQTSLMEEIEMYPVAQDTKNSA